MAHLLPRDTHVELDNRALLRRKELAALLGVIASEWASVELAMTYLYATMLGKYLPHNQRKGPPEHPIAFQIFDSLENTHKRLQLLDKLLNAVVTKKALRKEFKERTQPLIKKAADRRNSLIHSYWGVNDDYPRGLIRVCINKPRELYEASDFNEAINLIISADASITNFEVKVSKQLRWKKPSRLISSFAKAAIRVALDGRDRREDLAIAGSCLLSAGRCRSATALRSGAAL